MQPIARWNHGGRRRGGFLGEAAQKVAVGPFDMAIAGGYDPGSRTGRDDGEQAVIHRRQFLHAPAVIRQLVSFRRWTVRLTAPLGKSAQGVLLAVEEDDLMEAGTSLVRQALQLPEKLHPAQELGNHDIMPGGQMDPRCGKSDRPSEQTR